MTTQPQGRLATITPQEAERLLGRNVGNRRVRESVVAAYAADMAAGDWHVGTSMIVIDTDGFILDGQHRLYACVQADVAFTTFIVQGVDPSARAGIDVGVKRSLADLLQWKGYSNTSRLAASARYGWIWANTRVEDRFTRPTFDQCVEWIGRNPSIVDAVPPAMNLQKNLGVSAGMSGAMIHRMRLVDYEAAGEFMEQVETGVGLAIHSPTLALRNWMASRAANMTRGSRRELPVAYHFVWLKAWNAYVLGRDIKALKFVPRERFPEMLDTSGDPVEMVDEVDLTDNTPDLIGAFAGID